MASHKRKLAITLCIVALLVFAVSLTLSSIRRSLGDQRDVYLNEKPRMLADRIFIPISTKLSQSAAAFKKTHSTNSSRSVHTPYINPGCIKHSLNAYRPMQTSLEYHHPLIVHYVKLSTSDGATQSLTFRDYLAMMSAYKFLRPKRILVHSNGKISGEYWDLAQKWAGTSVEVNPVKRVTQLNGKRVGWIQISADYVKVSQLLEYGGLVSDFDVIIINGTRLKEEQRRSECVIAQEGDIPNAGFVSCVKNSSFMRQWLKAYHDDYNPSSWLYNSAIVPNNILLGKTSSVCYNMYLDDTICVHPNAKEAPIQWLSRNGVPHWREKTAAHYYLNRARLPPDGELLKADTSFGEMLRYVYEYKV